LTLVEVLIALCLLGVATTLVGSALARSVSAVRDSRLDLLAATSQLNRLESLRVSTADSCPASLSGASIVAGQLLEHWRAIRTGPGLLVVDSILPGAGSRHPLRALTATVRCP
jgi:type II secretory pathway pseudopilin PulG